MRLFALALAAVTACKAQEGTPPKQRVTEAEATAFATKLVPLLSKCNEETIAPLIDLEAMAIKSGERDLTQRPIGAKILCASTRGADEIKLLRVHAVAGEQRPVLRRFARDTRTGAIVVGYDELQLSKSTEVRIVDAYSYLQGQWISELLATNRDPLAASVDFLGNVPDAARTARDLQRQGKSAEALAMIDALPKEQRQARGVQLVRVRAAAGVGRAEHKQALGELAELFPNDSSIAIVQANGAIALEDWQAALKWIDVIDRAIGGDAVQEAHRAVAYLRLGDLDRARAAADKATTDEPTLSHGWDVKLEVVIAQKKWADAVAVMTVLEDKHGVRLDAMALAAVPEAAELLASPEYKEWRAGRQR